MVGFGTVTVKLCLWIGMNIAIKHSKAAEGIATAALPCPPYVPCMEKTQHRAGVETATILLDRWIDALPDQKSIEAFAVVFECIS
jgi:hypothetical protein